MSGYEYVVSFQNIGMDSTETKAMTGEVRVITPVTQGLEAKCLEDNINRALDDLHHNLYDVSLRNLCLQLEAYGFSATVLVGDTSYIKPYMIVKFEIENGYVFLRDVYAQM